MTFKRVTSPVAGDASHYGGLDINKFADYLGATDIGASETVDIVTLTTFRDSKFTLRNPANTFSYVFVPSAIAASRNVTVPLLTGNDQMTFDSHATTLTNKTVSYGSNTLDGVTPAHAATSNYLRYGAHVFNTGSAATGILSGFLTSVGTYTYAFDSTYGAQGNWTTTSTSGNDAGFYTSGTLVRTARNPILNCVFLVPTTTSARIFIGFLQTAPTGGGTDPLNAQSGVMLAINGGNFQMASNDGSGATTFTDFSPAKAVDASVHKFSMVVSGAGTSILCNLDNGTNTVTLTTNIPVVGQGLRGTAYVETATTATRDLTIVVWEGLF